MNKSKYTFSPAISTRSLELMIFDQIFDDKSHLDLDLSSALWLLKPREKRSLEQKNQLASWTQFGCKNLSKHNE
jgi:hypothetical protein